MAEQLRHEIRERGFKLKAIDPILMGFNLVTEPPDLDGDPPKLEAMARRWSKKIESDDTERKAFVDHWHRYKNALFSAFNYLRNRFTVHDESYLPSANMLATLAVFFFHHPGQPDARQAAEIRKWFWATGLAKRYSGAGYHRNIAWDARFFEAIGNGTKRIFKLDDFLDPVLDIQAEEYAAGSARTRTFFCLLLVNNPGFSTAANPSSRTAKQSVTATKSTGTISSRERNWRSTYPLAFTTASAISVFLLPETTADRYARPQNYLADYQQANREQFQSVMKSHLIPVAADSGIWDRVIVKGFKKFRQHRLALICAAFEKEAGMKLFRWN